MTPDHLAVDMDDVIVDFVGGLIGAMQKEHGATITQEQLAAAGWNLHPLLDPIVGYSWWTWLRENERLWANFPAVDGAIGAIRRLHRAGHYMELVTAKPEWARHNVWRWLGKWHPEFDRVTIVDTDASKVDATDAAWIIDDKPSHCADFIRANRNAILFARPHNQGDRHHFRHVASTWGDVLTILEDHPNGR